MRSICLSALIAATSAWAVTAAEEGVQVGLLACSLTDQSNSEADGAAAAATRQALCAFKPQNGAQETYVGKIQVVNLSVKETVTFVWRVKVPPMTPASPGFLEQNYAADPRTPANQMPDLIGQANSSIVLQSMADRKEGSASAKEKSPTDGVGVMGIDLNLKSTTG